MNVNNVTLAGNLTRSPELKHTANGSTLAKFGLAVNRTRTVNGEKKQTTCFVDVVAWGKQAEVIAEYLKKGDPIYLEGRLDFSQWEKDGQKRSKLEVVLEQFQFVGSRKDDSGNKPAAKDYGDIPF